jgi:hypothetical protein
MALTLMISYLRVVFPPLVRRVPYDISVTLRRASHNLQCAEVLIKPSVKYG